MIAKFIGVAFGALCIVTGSAPANATSATGESQGAHCAAAENTNSDLKLKIDRLVDDAASRGFAGGVTVIRDGVIIYDRVAGSASMEDDVPVTNGTLFHVASISKYFTAALVLRAAEEGRISLDDSIAAYAPGTKTAERGVTYADLLAHVSGLGSSYVAEAYDDAEDALKAIDNAGFDPDRVGGFRYSNDGYDLLAILMERIYGEPFETLMREKIFAPACLRHASFWGLEDVGDPNIVSQPLRSVSPDLSRRNYGMIGSAGLLITAHDLALYQYRLMRGGILSQLSLEDLTTPRGDVSIGWATYGAFLTETDALGPRLNARGYEDWGDNAILNHYLGHDVIVAIVTSRGPAESTGAPPFRNELSDAVEGLLTTATELSEK